METPTARECFIIPRKYYDKRGKETDNSLQGYRQERITASLSEAKVTSAVSKGQVTNKIKTLRGVLTMSDLLHTLETNDRIEYGGKVYTITSFEKIEYNKTIAWISNYRIEAE